MLGEHEAQVGAEFHLELCLLSGLTSGGSLTKTASEIKICTAGGQHVQRQQLVLFSTHILINHLIV